MWPRSEEWEGVETFSATSTTPLVRVLPLGWVPAPFSHATSQLLTPEPVCQACQGLCINDDGMEEGWGMEGDMEGGQQGRREGGQSPGISLQPARGAQEAKEEGAGTLLTVCPFSQQESEQGVGRN